MFPLAGRARSGRSFRIIHALNRMDGRAAHPAQGRSLVARNRSVRAHLERIPAFGPKPAALSSPVDESNRIGGTLPTLYGVHEALSVAEKVRLSAIDLPQSHPTRALPLLPPRLRSYYGGSQLLPQKEVKPTKSYFAVEANDYLPLVRRLGECEMIELSAPSELKRYPRFIVKAFLRFQRDLQRSSVSS